MFSGNLYQSTTTHQPSSTGLQASELTMKAKPQARNIITVGWWLFRLHLFLKGLLYLIVKFYIKV